MKTFVRLIPLAILAASTSIALADDALNLKTETRSKTVQFSRAVAQTEPGASKLYGKLRWAAFSVCAPGEFPRGVEGKLMRSCAAEALDNAVVEVNVPAVTALHHRRGTVEVLASRR